VPSPIPVEPTPLPSAPPVAPEENKTAITSPPAELPSAPTGPAKPEKIQMSSVFGKVRTLSEVEQMQYLACEEVIDSGWSTYVQVGLALATIRDLRLYRGDFPTFQDYCRQRWEYGRRYVDQLISAAQVFTYLRATGSQTPPEHERQVRPLIGLTSEQARLAWAKAVERAAGRAITARLVKNVVQSLRSGAVENLEAPKEKRPSNEGKRRLIDAAIGELLLLLSQKVSHTVLTEKVEALHGHIQTLFAKPPAKKQPTVGS
jgi:hypothetical protein